MNVLSLFTGIGGLDLGLERAGMTVVGQVEIDLYCRRVLARHWPEVPRHDDVRTALAWWRSAVRPAVDVIAGGFPCQPVSVAGQGLAQADERWLWPEFADVLRQLRPRYAILENVPGLLGRGVGDVLGDLAALGYDAEWDCIPAAAVGAPHLRDRWFCVAYTSGDRWEPRWSGDAPERPGRGESGGGDFGAEDVADSAGPGSPRRSGAPSGRPGPAFRLELERLGDGRPWPRPTPSGHWASEPDVGGGVDGVSAGVDGDGVEVWERGIPRVLHGVPGRVARLRGLGNAVVPQVAEHIGRMVMDWEAS